MVLKVEPKDMNAAIQDLMSNQVDYVSEQGTAGPLSTDQFIDGVYHQLDGSVPGTRTTPTAAEIVAAIRGCKERTSFEFVVHNAHATLALTVAGGTGVTGFGTLTVAAGKNRVFKCVVTSTTTPAVAMYGLAELA